MARPTIYTDEIADQILERLADGETLRAICKDEALPSDRAVRRWALDDLNGFAEKYSRAREIGYHVLADEIIDISDDARNDWMQRQDDEGGTAYVLNGEHVQRSRLRVDSRKWFLSKVLPKIYGDKVALTGAGGGPIETIQLVGVKPADPTS